MDLLLFWDGWNGWHHPLSALSLLRKGPSPEFSELHQKWLLIPHSIFFKKMSSFWLVDMMPYLYSAFSSHFCIGLLNAYQEILTFLFWGTAVYSFGFFLTEWNHSSSYSDRKYAKLLLHPSVLKNHAHKRESNWPLLFWYGWKRERTVKCNNCGWISHGLAITEIWKNIS